MESVPRSVSRSSARGNLEAPNAGGADSVASHAAVVDSFDGDPVEHVGISLIQIVEISVRRFDCSEKAVHSRFRHRISPDAATFAIAIVAVKSFCQAGDWLKLVSSKFACVCCSVVVDLEAASCADAFDTAGTLVGERLAEFGKRNGDVIAWLGVVVGGCSAVEVWILEAFRGKFEERVAAHLDIEIKAGSDDRMIGREIDEELVAGNRDRCADAAGAVELVPDSGLDVVTVAWAAAEGKRLGTGVSAEFQLVVAECRHDFEIECIGHDREAWVAIMLNFPAHFSNMEDAVRFKIIV